MTILKKLFDFYINSSIHVALSVFSLTWITLMEYDIPCDADVLYFVFFSSITGYNFVKYFGIAKFHHRRLARSLKAIQVFSFFSFLMLCYYTLKLNTLSLLCIVGFALVTFFYAIPFLPKRFFIDNHYNLRRISGLKVYLIALVWSGVTVFLPLINNDYPINVDVVITGIQRFLFIIVLMLPFEIRDLQYDSLKLATIPQKIGVRWTKIIGALLLMCFCFLEFFKNKVTINYLIVLFAMALITMLFVIVSKKNQGMYYSSFFVEGLPILWLIMLFFLDYFN
ncbi:UbiA prenyltransferase family protein [Confluentibacter citreus]|uniref:hypothetical protein n=1 Tax=Confluentibacter citreus TaxID=2007307 RepID=UPI000C284FD6|nr:hypothetical protein [Confluentibacter citreus]